MKKSFVSTDPTSNKGNTDIWLTPIELIERIGEFDFDPCPYKGHQTAKFLGVGDGLKSKWVGKVWLNPPYSDAERWIYKLSQHGYGCALVFVRTGTSYMQSMIRSADTVVLLKGRISFLKPDGTRQSNAGADSMLLCWGFEPVDKSLGVFLSKRLSYG